MPQPAMNGYTSHCSSAVDDKELGVAITGLYVPEEYGGSGLGRLDGALVFEGLAYGDVSTAAYLTIHNMYVASLESTFIC